MPQNAQTIILMLVWVAALAVFMYFTMIRPNRRRRKENEAMFASMENGDYVLTTSGFYGELVDVQDDMVIVEFGGNKNCRIAMKKDCIEQVEKAQQTYKKPVETTAESKDKKDKK